ncbi:MAG: hypothetical protein M1820_009555 [Bogoriella megaspora]|nr:MAG: hypothetical protein M1820_009555 [Bogoriella megaspora]
MAYTSEPCGCYYIRLSSPMSRTERIYLPQVQLKSYTAILSTCSRTELTQTFVNTSTTHGIKELRYVFPFYDGVSVVGFTCTIRDRVITGVVKEREKARKDFKEAVNRGQQAGLFEQSPNASDVFTTTVGNVPPSTDVVVKVTYLGELKSDAESDNATRFTIPMCIAPRYSSYGSKLAQSTSGVPWLSKGMEITVDAIMPDGSFIQGVESPSHRLAVSIGTVSKDRDAAPRMNRASATLTLDATELDRDFILRITNKDTGTPKAVLETHPTIANQRALMVSLIPRFSLPIEKPEIVFVADRSGSMGGKVGTLVSALKMFLKSLPVGVMFNICSFGSSYSFLWNKSQSYGQATLDEAIFHAEGFEANFGGTEMYQPIEATIRNRFTDLSLEIIFLTDGEIWDQKPLFGMLNDEITKSKSSIRVFTLGIGSGISTSLIEGVARAGNGFAQFVQDGESYDRKVVHMLKGALSPHVGQYTLEVDFADGNDDFELVDEFDKSLQLDISSEAEQNTSVEQIQPRMQTAQPISLYNTDVNHDQANTIAEDSDDNGQSRYSHLPKISSPKILQAPNQIPPLFPFNRTAVYLLLSPETNKETPKAVILRANSKHGPLQLKIPIEVLDQPGETYHQLAAKKAIQELEEGRGWIFSARDSDGKTFLKDKLPGQFPQMVEREAVRLGIQFQVGGKWCSFVALEPDCKDANNREGQPIPDSEGYEFLDVPVFSGQREPAPYDRSPEFRAARFSSFGSASGFCSAAGSGTLFGSASSPSSVSGSGLFSSTRQPQSGTALPSTHGTRGGFAAFGGGGIGRSSGMYGEFGMSSASPSPAGLFGNSTNPSGSGSASRSPVQDLSANPSKLSPMENLINLQTFQGYWFWSEQLRLALGLRDQKLEYVYENIDKFPSDITSTAIVVAFFEKKLAEEQQVWELVIGKAKSWLEEQVVDSGKREELMKKAANIFN